MPDENQSRIDNLEIQLAHQGQVLDDLNELVTRQAQRIERLEGQAKALYERQIDLEETSSTDVPVTKPPHY